MLPQNTGSNRSKTFKRGTHLPTRLTEAERLEERQAARQLAVQQSSSNSNSNRGAARRSSRRRGRKRTDETPSEARIRRRANMVRLRTNTLESGVNIPNKIERDRYVTEELDMLENRFSNNNNYDKSASDGESVPALARNLEVGQRYSVTTKLKDIPTTESRKFEGTYKGLHGRNDGFLSFSDIFWVKKNGDASRSSLRILPIKPNNIKKIHVIHRTD